MGHPAGLAGGSHLKFLYGKLGALYGKYSRDCGQR
jgi:hypothetical protein